MHPLVGDFAIFAIIAQLSQLSLGVWTPGKAAQISFYTSSDSGCVESTGEATFWWTSSPQAAGNGSITGAGCGLLNMPGNSTGLNITMMWGQSTMSDTVEPAQVNGGCTLWDEYECGTGHDASLIYVPGDAAEASCQAARSDQGNNYLWKSAKCFIDATTTQILPLSSTSTSATFSASSTSASTPPQSTTSAGRKSLSSATITGIATGAASLVVIFILVAFFIGRRNRQKPEVLLPYLQMPTQHGPEAQRQSSVPQVSEKPTRSTVGTLQDSLPRSAASEGSSHQFLIAGELRALRQEVERLNSAVTNGDGYDARIRALERELQSYGDVERPEPSLPGYSD